MDSCQVSRGWHYSGTPWGLLDFRLRACHPLWCAFPHASPNPLTPTSGPYNPGGQVLRFGLFRFRSPLLTESFHFLFLWLLRCFTSPGFAPSVLCIQTAVARYDSDRVTPFGNLRIIAYLPLPEAYRSLSRPSSPTGTKAFIMCS